MFSINFHNTINQILAIKMCIWPWHWHLEWAKVKYKCTNQEVIQDFIFDGNSNICSIYHHLRDIRKSNKMPTVWPWKLRSRLRRGKGIMSFDWECLILICWFFFRILATRQQTFKQTWTHTFMHTQRETWAIAIGKSAKQVCLETSN